MFTVTKWNKSALSLNFHTALCWTAAYELVSVGLLQGKVVDMLRWIPKPQSRLA